VAEPALLIGTAAAPVPDGAVAEWVVGAGGCRLRAALFPPGRAARGSVVVSPGRTEAIEKYFEVAGRLTARGSVVLVHDWRGQGLSDRPLADRRLGHASGFADFLTDFAAVVAAFESRLPKPWYALGHSMGGCLTLLAMAEGEKRFEGAILSAPMLGLRTGSTPVALASRLASAMTALGRGAGATPGQDRGEPAPFSGNALTHDRPRYERNIGQLLACPDLILGAPTWGWLDFAFIATTRLAKGDGVLRVTVPVMIVAAGDDLIVDNAGSRRVASRLAKGRYEEIPGAYHEILQETDELQAPFWSLFDQLVAGSSALAATESP
jgi:lysophospholipase